MTNLNDSSTPSDRPPDDLDPMGNLIKAVEVHNEFYGEQQPTPPTIPDVQKPDCSRHRKDVNGVTDMKALAEEIGNLHYEMLRDLFIHLATKFYSDAKKDFSAGREKLAQELNWLSNHMSSAASEAESVWQISKPFMEPNKK